MEKRTKKLYRLNNSKRSIILEHIRNNIRIYFYFTLIFFIGICIGVITINHMNEEQRMNIQTCINSSIEFFKNEANINEHKIFTQSFIKNFLTTLFISIITLTFFGNQLLLLATLLFGIALGYSTAALMTALNFGKGFLFIIVYVLPANIIALPAFLYLIVQGYTSNLLLYKQKITGINYTVLKFFCSALFTLVLLFISSAIESYFSYNSLHSFIKYL